jgi:hypothetical protein
MLAERWNKAIILPESVARVPTQLIQPELQYLHWYMSEVYTGQGESVEQGCYLGGSTAASASGLVINTHPEARDRIIHVYDLFTWGEYELDLYKQQWGGPEAQSYKLGDSFEPLFYENVAPWRQRIRTYSGDILQHHWNGAAIEFLFVDVMKTPEIARHVTREFFPSLRAGLSTLVQQDFKHYYTYWIHLLMYRLREYFQPQYSIVGASSVTFTCIQQVSLEACERACDFGSFTLDEIHASFQYSLDICGADEPTRCEIETAWMRTYLDGIRSMGAEHIHSALNTPWPTPIGGEIRELFPLDVLKVEA